jgi:hypothetical protein
VRSLYQNVDRTESVSFLQLKAAMPAPVRCSFRHPQRSFAKSKDLGQQGLSAARKRTHSFGCGNSEPVRLRKSEAVRDPSLRSRFSLRQNDGRSVIDRRHDPIGVAFARGFRAPRRCRRPSSVRDQARRSRRPHSLQVAAGLEL